MMLIYIIPLLITAFFSFNKKVLQKLLLPFFMTYLALFIGFRYEIGGDWSNYLDMLYTIKGFNSPIYSTVFTDPAYGLLNYFTPVSWFGNGISFINFICASIFSTGLYYFCKRQSNPFLSLSIAMPYLIIVVAMGYTRQSAAIGFALLALLALFENKLKLYIILTICGALFHLTEIIMLIFLIARMNSKNLIKNTLIFFICSTIAIYLLQNSILSRVSMYGTDQTVNSEGGIFRIIINCLPALIFICNYNFFKKYLNEKIIIFNTLLILSIGTFILFFLSFFASTLSDRIALYFMPLQMMVYPIILHKLSNNFKLAIQILILLSYQLIFLIWITSSIWAKEAWLPYQNFLFSFF